MRFLKLALALLIASPALAADLKAPVAPSATGACVARYLCDGQTATGVACGTGGAYVGDGAGRKSVFYATRSTAAAYSCSVMTSDSGSASALSVNLGTLTGANPSLGTNNPYRKFWANCDTITGPGTATVVMLSCPW